MFDFRKWLYDEIKSLAEFENVGVYFRTDEAYRAIQNKQDVVWIDKISERFTYDNLHIVSFQIDIYSQNLEQVEKLVKAIMKHFNTTELNGVRVELGQTRDLSSISNMPREMISIRLSKKMDPSYYGL